MISFFDLMREAQQNAFGTMIEKEFGLSRSEQAKALEAMIPAFFFGMRKNASDPFGVAAFWQMLAGGPYGSYFDNPFAAATPKAMAEGNSILEKLFGSPEIARAVSLQVEAATGIAQDVVRRMMPVYANMMMGGLQRQAEAAPNPFLTMMQGMANSAADAARPQRAKQGETNAELPFVTFMNSMLGAKPTEPSRADRPAPSPTNEEVIDRWFGANRAMQNTYWRSMERIFEQMASEKKN